MNEPSLEGLFKGVAEDPAQVAAAGAFDHLLFFGACVHGFLFPQQIHHFSRLLLLVIAQLPFTQQILVGSLVLTKGISNVQQIIILLPC